MTRILVTGATGFVGARLCDRLLEQGHTVLAGTRHPEQEHAARPGLTFCHIDLADRASIAGALELVDEAVYLVHGMTDSVHFARVERKYAENFVAAAEQKKTGRIVYVGGPRPRGKVSHHLASRLRTGEILRSGSVPVVELQATMIIGDRSESFRIVRDLAARLPVMLLPRWLKSKSQPVAIDDVTRAIAFALEMPLETSIVLGMPGPEVMSAREMVERTAHLMGHDPVLIDVPFLTPRLSSEWIGLVTRADRHVGRELAEGLRSDLVMAGPTIWDRMPDAVRLPFEEAVRRALADDEKTLTHGARALEGFLHHLARDPRAT